MYSRAIHPSVCIYIGKVLIINLCGVFLRLTERKVYDTKKTMEKRSL